MTEALKAVVEDGLMELVLERPLSGPLLLDAALRSLIHARLRDIPHDIRAILIRAGIHVFTMGPDLPRPDDARSPDLATLCAAVEHCRVPVVMLIEGQVAGPWTELGLSAWGRLMAPGARIVSGEIALGLMSGAGGTQRLARLIGAEQAIRLFQDGAPVGAAEALALGLVDQVIEGEDREAIVQASRTLVAAATAGPDHPFAPPGARTDGLRDGRAFLRAISAARSALPAAAATPAQRALIDCVEAAMLLPYAQGLDFEAAVAVDLAASEEAAALGHMFRAERRAAQMPQGLTTFTAAPVARLGISGAAPAFAGVVLTALLRGLSVTLAEADRPRLVQLLETIAARQEAAVQAGQLTSAQRDADWARLEPSLEPSALAEADLILAAPDAPLPPAKPGRAVLMIGRGALPDGVFRMTLTGRVAELGLPQGAPGQAAAQAWLFLRRLGLHVVATGLHSPQGVAGRLSGAGGAAIRALVGLGVPPEDVATALTDFGLPRPGLPEPADVPPRAMPPAEIVDRWLGALANEGARLLSAGMAQSPLDIDLVAVTGLGFPRLKGGPLHQADRRGLLVVRRDLSDWGREAALWQPVPAWDAFVSVGRGFAGSVS